MSRRRTIKWIARGLIVFVCFGLLELLMIVLDPYLFKGLFENDPDMGFRARAYFPTGLGLYGRGDDGTLTNQFGFNDKDYSLQKAPGAFRIVVVGDSFGWAGGLEGNYTARLEHMFEARDGFHRVDVINTGYPGTHTGEELMMLKKFALQYHPDLVILGFFAGNDFLDADPNRKRIVVNRYLVDIDKRYEHRFLGYPIIAKSRLRLFLQNEYTARAESRLARREALEWAAATSQPTPYLNLTEQRYYNTERAWLEIFNQRSALQRFSANTRFIFDSISEMNELLRSRGIKFMVAIYPDISQVSPTEFEALAQKFHLPKEDYDLNLPQNLLRPFLESKAIPYLDLLDRFRTEERQHELYLFRNTHWNDAGNDLAARMLYEYLNKQAYDGLTK